MIYSSFFILLVPVQFIQSKDLDRDSLDQKLSSIPNQSQFLLPTYLPTENNQSQFLLPTYLLTENNQSRRHRRSKPSRYSKVDDTSFVGISRLVLPIYILWGILVCILSCIVELCRKRKAAPPVNHEVNNRSTIELLQTSTEPTPVSTLPLVATWQNRDNHPLRLLTTQSSMRSTLLGISTASVQQPPEYNHSSARRETTISMEQPDSSLPPAYDEVIQRSSTTMLMEQELLTPPPTYDDCLREN